MGFWSDAKKAASDFVSSVTGGGGGSDDSSSTSGSSSRKDSKVSGSTTAAQTSNYGTFQGPMPGGSAGYTQDLNKITTDRDTGFVTENRNRDDDFRQAQTSGGITYDAANSIELEWPEDEKIVVMRRCLEYIGINLRAGDIVGYANSKLKDG